MTAFLLWVALLFSPPAAQVVVDGPCDRWVLVGEGAFCYWVQVCQ